MRAVALLAPGMTVMALMSGIAGAQAAVDCEAIDQPAADGKAFPTPVSKVRHLVAGGR